MKVNFTELHKKHTQLSQKQDSYEHMSTTVLAYLVMNSTIQVIARPNLILRVIYDTTFAIMMAVAIDGLQTIKNNN